MHSGGVGARGDFSHHQQAADVLDNTALWRLAKCRQVLTYSTQLGKELSPHPLQKGNHDSNG